MDDERTKRILLLVERLIDLDAEERARILDDECEDEEIRAAVLELLDVRGDIPSGFAAAGDAMTDAATGVPHTGDRVGDFVLGDEIGAGAMGTVFRARQEGMDREVAVKIVGRAMLISLQGAERFRREVRAAGKLDHPGIANILVHGIDGDCGWYAMEFVEGHSLAEELRRQRDPDPVEPSGLPRFGTTEHARAVARLVMGVADALQHAHDRGVIHRDVKPSNLILTADRTAKLVDFGVAKDTTQDGITRTEQVVGSLPYMSPEQTRGVMNEVDARTDVYSLGAVMYELLTHHRPFEGGSPPELIRRICVEDPASIRRQNARVPRDLAVICRGALEKEPGDRYAQAGDMREDLRRFLSDESIVRVPPSLPVRGRRWLRRNARVVALVVVAVAALGLGWWVRRSTEPPEPGGTLEVAGPAGGSVSIRWLDPLTGEPGRVETIGTTPLGRTRLELGHARILVTPNGASRPRVYSREILDGRQVLIVVDERASNADSTEGMVRFDGGTVGGDAYPVSPYSMVEVDVAPFWMDECEVSVGDFREYLDANPEVERPIAWSLLSKDGELDDRPMVFVSWSEASAYAEWRGKRLPSHAEWVWAARGKDDRRFPWGEPPEYRGATAAAEVFVNRDLDSSFSAFVENTVPVDSFEDAETPDGLRHMLGNVWEWTETRSIDPRAVPQLPKALSRVARGGAWDIGARRSDLRLPTQFYDRPTNRFADVGFRCARSAQ